jgi:murein DD-endopeptidase MepM/ murein hydrolase activator NlpD
MLLAGAQDAAAQSKKKGWFRKIFKVKAPEIEYVDLNEEKSFADTLRNFGGGGEDEIEAELRGELGEEENSAELILAEEPEEELEEEVFVEISEELQIKKEWLNLHEYFTTWDSRNVNPYEIDAAKFADTVSLLLFDTLAQSGWSPPLAKTEVTSNFGFRGYRWHYGTDIRLSTGDSVRTVFDGIVRMKKYDPRGYGYYVLVRHKNGLETLYGHLSKQMVEVGDEIRAGQVIGLGGSTGRSSGPHLHFEFRYQGNPVNPTDVYDFKQNALSADSLVISPETFTYVKEARKIHFHKVRRGDTLSGISRRYGVPINKLCSLNRIKKTSVLRVGQRIRIN